MASESKMRREASSLIGENIVAEIAPFSPAPSVKDGSEIRPSPFVYVPRLWEKIQSILELSKNYMDMATTDKITIIYFPILEQIN